MGVFRHVTADSDFIEGNAVIAARDVSGTILWSWHIWMTDKPDDHVYNNEAGISDRHIVLLVDSPRIPETFAA